MWGEADGPRQKLQEKVCREVGGGGGGGGDSPMPNQLLKGGLLKYQWKNKNVMMKKGKGLS